MTPLSFLQRLSSEALLSPAQREKNARSLQTLQERLATHFAGQIIDSFSFGSAKRGTVLPQHLSESMDIDVFVVFKDDGRVPLTYLQRLLQFSKQWYPRSRVRQASPAVVIELAHVQFELVPAVTAFWNPYKIPCLDGSWQGADPERLAHKVVEANIASQGLLKPAIRLAKLWNSHNGLVFDSYALEEQCCDLDFYGAVNVRDYFYRIPKGLDLGWLESNWRHDCLAKARRTIDEANQLERAGNEASAVRLLQKLFP